MTILGIHDGHNASACLLEDGQIKAALQEERITRIKNDFTFPNNAIKRILEMTKLSSQDVDKIVLASDHLPPSKNKKEMMESYKESEGNDIKVLLKNTLRKTIVYNIYRNKRRRQRIQCAVNMGFKEDKISFVEHHLCHSSAAYWGSSFDKDGKTLVLTADGGGDNLCATVNVAENGKITRIAEVDWSNSIGSIYAKITYLLGMVPNEHEYKLMGMSPYGDADGAKKIYTILQGLFRFENGGLSWKRENHVPHTHYSYEFLKKKFERMRFDWIARGLQEWIEDFLCEWVTNCIKATDIHTIVLGGGVFMNVKANKKISELNLVDQLFVFPSCGDETNPIGAAYFMSNK